MTLQNSFDPYSRWLGLPVGPRPPNHYTLLGIDRLESDSAVIVHAADVQMAKVRKIRPGEHIRDWRRLLDRIDAAKARLLDPASKTTYDVDLRAEPTSAASAMKIAPPPPILSTPTQTPTVLQESDSTAWSEQVRPTVTITASKPIRKTPYASALSSLYWFLLGSVLTAVVMLFVMCDRSAEPEPVVVDEPKQPSVVPAPSMLPPAPHPPPRVVPELPKPPAEPPQVKPEPPQVKPEPLKPESPKLPVEPLRVEPVQPPAEPQIDAKRQEVFDQAVSDARHAMTRRNLSGAEDYLQTAAENTQTVDDDNQLNRLETMLHNLREFWTGIREGVAKLEAAGELPIGNTRIAIVEATRDRLTFRAAGQNHRYQIEQLPTVVVLAIADNCFKKGVPSTQVLIGTFLAVDPDGNRQRARLLWNAAIKQGIDIENLLPELDVQ